MTANGFAGFGLGFLIRRGGRAITMSGLSVSTRPMWARTPAIVRGQKPSSARVAAFPARSASSHQPANPAAKSLKLLEVRGGIEPPYLNWLISAENRLIVRSKCAAVFALAGEADAIPATPSRGGGCDDLGRPPSGYRVDCPRGGSASGNTIIRRPSHPRKGTQVSSVTSRGCLPDQHHPPATRSHAPSSLAGGIVHEYCW
jgi:hypothetical protein